MFAGRMAVIFKKIKWGKGHTQKKKSGSKRTNKNNGSSGYVRVVDI